MSPSRATRGIRDVRAANGGVRASAAPAPVRWTKVESARARIASGFYETDEVQAFLVDAVLRELRED